jgi:hypothetical protein
LIVTIIYSTAFVGLNNFHPLLWRELSAREEHQNPLAESMLEPHEDVP